MKIKKLLTIISLFSLVSAFAMGCGKAQTSDPVSQSTPTADPVEETAVVEEQTPIAPEEEVTPTPTDDVSSQETTDDTELKYVRVSEHIFITNYDGEQSFDYTMEYNDKGLVTKRISTDDSSDITTYEYDENDKLIKEVSPYNTITYEYDDRGNCVKEIHEDGSYNICEYDDKNNLTRDKCLVDGNDIPFYDNIYENTYDDNGVLQSVIKKGGDEEEGLSWETVVKYTYNSDGLLIKKEEGYEDSSPYFVDEYEYDEHQNIVKHIFTDTTLETRVTCTEYTYEELK